MQSILQALDEIYFLFKYKSEEAIKDGREEGKTTDQERDSNSQLTLALGRRRLSKSL